jgi:hypothetical protein
MEADFKRVIDEVAGKDHYEDVFDSLVAQVAVVDADARGFQPMAAEIVAETINECGFTSQVSYLLTHGKTADDLLAWLQQAYEARMDFSDEENRYVVYTATPTEHRVIEETPDDEDGRVVATCNSAADAARIARLLNADKEE